MRQLQDGNFALLLEQTRQDANTISHNTNLALQQSEEAAGGWKLKSAPSMMDSPN